jgi:lysophospholipase L1-like esterase
MRVLLLMLILLPMTTWSQKMILEEPVSLLALGDSYTVGESVTKNQRWPEILVDSLSQRGVDCLVPRVIAATGWRTDNLKSAIKKSKFKQAYNLVSLLIGVNNFYQQRPANVYQVEFEELLIKAIELAGGNPSRVFVLSIPDYGYTPFGQANQSTISAGIDSFNGINSAVAQKYRVTYVDITDISRKGLEFPSLLATDNLHPSGEMYAQWVARILEYTTMPKRRTEKDN